MSSETARRENALPARLWPALLVLGFSSGLPQQMVDGTFSAWLARAGYTQDELLRIGYVTLPFALKFLWAPLVDRFAPPFLGRRRGWILVCQLALVVGLLAMARLDPRGDFGLLLVTATLVALAGATQDLVVNGYTCDALERGQLAAGAGLAVWGYRAAWLVSGGLVLVVAGRQGFGAAYVAMALLLVPGMLATVLAPEPARDVRPATLRESLVVPIRTWRRDLGARGLVFLLLFALVYRLPDMVANLLAVTFQAELYDLTELGLWRGALGLVGAAGGVALAAATMPRLGTTRTLFLFGLAQAASNLGYVGLDRQWWHGTGGLVGVLLVENVCGALAGTAFVAYLMGFCTSASAATQYALLTAVTTLGPHALREPMAALSQRHGWSGFFLATTALVVPGLVLLAWMRPAEATPRTAALPK